MIISRYGRTLEISCVFCDGKGFLIKVDKETCKNCWVCKGAGCGRNIPCIGCKGKGIYFIEFCYY